MALRFNHGTWFSSYLRDVSDCVATIPVRTLKPESCKEQELHVFCVTGIDPSGGSNPPRCLNLSKQVQSSSRGCICALCRFVRGIVLGVRVRFICKAVLVSFPRAAFVWSHDRASRQPGLDFVSSNASVGRRALCASGISTSSHALSLQRVSPAVCLIVACNGEPRGPFNSGNVHPTSRSVFLV